MRRERIDGAGMGMGAGTGAGTGAGAVRRRGRYVVSVRRGEIQRDSVRQYPAAKSFGVSARQCAAVLSRVKPVKRRFRLQIQWVMRMPRFF